MWDVFKDWIFEAINFFYGLVGDWGLAIIIITVIFRIIVAPLMHKQAKSNYKMQKIQPQLSKIQEKYAGDQVRLNQEMHREAAGEVCRGSSQDRSRDPEALCGSSFQPVSWLSSHAASDAYLHSLIPGIEGNGW